jgi:hypothetical protein
MLELLINPKKAERNPWEMFFVGFFYAFLSLVIANFLFSNDGVLSKYMGIFVITFCVIFSLPYMYYTIKLEERKVIEYDDETKLLEEHGKAILTFLWLFLGFIVAFSIGYMIFPNGERFFNAQIEKFCEINRPGNFNSCLEQYGLKRAEVITGNVGSRERFFSIFSNNIYVLIFTLILSIGLGAGAIFILAWNASVIAAAIGIFIELDLSQLHIGLLRYMIHGLPEIAAYFIAALAGGILSIAVARHDTKSDRFWQVLQDSLNLIILSVVILVLAAAIEVFITPRFF